MDATRPRATSPRRNVDILTVHRAKGLEYPIVIIADILASASSRDNAFLDHRTGEGWLEIGNLVPDSGTDQLSGLKGSMEITIVDGEHFYDFEYSVPDS